MQGICDHNMVLLNVVAKWQGSTHDSFILQSSGIPDQFESGTFGTGWLLGDSGYSLKEWLLTPMAEPSTPQHRNYNVIHRKTRCLIERTFGLLKSRWRILDHTGGSLCYTPQRVSKIIMTCCVLHNICRRNGTPILGPNSPIAQLINNDDIESGSANTTSGIRQRERVADLMWSTSR